MKPLSLTPSRHDGSFEYLQQHLSHRIEWSPTHSATTLLVVALRYIRGSRKRQRRWVGKWGRMMNAPSLSQPSIYPHKGKGLPMQGDGHADKIRERRLLPVNIHFPSAFTKKKAARINMHEQLKEAGVTTPGLSHCMLIKHSSVW